MNVGDKIYDEYGEARIMAIAEGYAMARRPRAMPFVIVLKDIGKKWQPAQLADAGDVCERCGGKLIPFLWCEGCGRG